MVDDRVLGAAILVGGVVGIVLYGWLIFLSGWSLLVLQLTAFIAVTAVLAIIVWIGYTMATTPAYEPIEELEKESKTEEESKSGEGKS